MGSRRPDAIGGLPRRPGVYRFADRRGAVLYLGRAADLHGRVGSYWSRLHDRRHLAPMVEAIDSIEALVCESRHEAAWLERGLLEEDLPPYNRTAGGQESVVYIRVDARPGTAGVSVMHDLEPARDDVHRFGPYLGGLQARRAVAALRRVFPLDYCAAAGGSGGALASKRAVTARDRPQLVAAIGAVLSRDAIAVEALRGRLERTRERACAARRYELAGRVQSELEGIAWVTGPQRVAQLEPIDLDVHGWSDGILVTLGVRRGRVRRWSTISMDRPCASPLVEASPEPWRGLMAANAALAAGLRAEMGAAATT